MSFEDFTAHKAETQKIIDAHCNDFNANNVQEYLDKHGGYKAYVRSLGGVFKKYVDFTGKITSKEQLDEICDYVWGLYDIWGVDYSNGCSYTWSENRYKAYCGSSGAFYPSESPKARFNMNYGTYGFANDKDMPTVDEMLSRPSKYYAITNCSQGVSQALKKAGLIPSWYPDPAYYPQYFKDHNFGYSVLRNAKDLQPGDVVLFYNHGINRNVSSVPNWSDGLFHTAIVGERTDKYIIMYDAGHAYTYYGECRNWRRIGDDNVYQWAADWIALRYDVVAKLSKPTGWKKISGQWYYYENGTPVTGWHFIKWSKGTDWFYFNADGVMLTGLQEVKWKDNYYWFYFDSNGAMKTGKIKVNVNFNKSGQLTGGK